MTAQKTFKQFKSIELFAGAGGLAIGLEKAGFEHIGLVENNKAAATTLKTNLPTGMSCAKMSLKLPCAA